MFGTAVYILGTIFWMIVILFFIIVALALLPKLPAKLAEFFREDPGEKELVKDDTDPLPAPQPPDTVKIFGRELNIQGLIFFCLVAFLFLWSWGDVLWTLYKLRAFPFGS